MTCPWKPPPIVLPPGIDFRPLPAGQSFALAPRPYIRAATAQEYAVKRLEFEADAALAAVDPVFAAELRGAE